VVEDEDLERGYTRESEDIPGVIEEEKEAGTHMGKDSLRKGKMTGRFSITNTASQRLANKGVLTVSNMLLYFHLFLYSCLAWSRFMEMYISKLPFLG
jgi:hypothetical protein